MTIKNISIYVTLRDITLDGGGERIVFNLVNEFCKRYDDVHLISHYKTFDEFKYVKDPRVKVHYLNDKPYLNVVSAANPIKYLNHLFWHTLSITGKVNKILKQSTPKGNTPILITAGFDTPFCKVKGAKFIGLDCSHSIVWKSRQLLGRIFMVFRRAMQCKLDVAAVLSDAQLDDWALLCKPVRIVTNFVTDIPQTVLPQCEREKTIIAAGRMWDGQKGFDRLIEHYSDIATKYPDWTLKIFGEGSLKESYQKIIDDRGVGEFVKLMPFSTDIYSEYSKASIYAMTSRWEGFGLVTVEAMCCGAVPVALAAQKPSGTSFILHDMPQCLAGENDMDGFMTILETMMQSEELREQTAQQARDLVYDRFSSEVLMEQWSELFDELTIK